MLCGFGILMTFLSDKEHEDHYSIDWVRSTVNSFKLADKDGDGLDKSEFHL